MQEEENFYHSFCLSQLFKRPCCFVGSDVKVQSQSQEGCWSSAASRRLMSQIYARIQVYSLSSAFKNPPIKTLSWKSLFFTISLSVAFVETLPVTGESFVSPAADMLLDECLPQIKVNNPLILIYMSD